MKNFVKKVIVKLNVVRIPVIFFYIFRIFPINKNKIVLVNFSGKGYGDSPKYIAEMLLNNHKYKLIWLIKNLNENDFPSKIKKVKIFTIKSIYELATSRVWINNSRFDLFVTKRPGQLYIQTWHGGIALKKIEYDAVDKLSDYYKKVMVNDGKLIDIMVSNSKFCTNMYKTAFKFNGKILEVGTPRNDCLVNKKQLDDINIKTRKKFNIDNEKVLLYVPTFRKSYENNPYDIDFESLKKNLEDKTCAKWKIVIRLHPRIKNVKELIPNIDKYIDASKYNDIQELICMSDIVITDYSSTMFESMIAQKPVIIYSNDIEKYKEDRGIYFKLESLPFMIAKNNNELKNIILNINKDNYLDDYNLFFENVGLNETGESCKKIVEIIEKNME